MRGYRTVRFTPALLLAAALLLSPLGADAAGYYNLPSSAPQCVGYGVGPGYHANLLIGRSCKARTATKSVRRMPAPFHPSQAPPVTVGFGEMSAWRAPLPCGAAGW